MSQLILLRHGESLWNQNNLFTGWVDVPLSQKGIQQAMQAGREMKDLPIHVIFSTSLIRAQMTAMLAMAEHSPEHTPIVMHPDDSKMEEWSKIFSEETKLKCIPVYCAWELNERMYGELQGLNKAETAEKFGKEQVHRWRRSYDEPPPNGESLAMTAARSIPYFKEQIIPFLKEGQNVLISAHGNSLRSIIMYLDGLDKDEVVQLEVPTGHPIFYTYEAGLFKKAERSGTLQS